jgi:hypothetical protein
MRANARRTDRFAALVFAVAGMAGTALAAPEAPAHSVSSAAARPAPAGFARLTALAGEWVAAEDGEMGVKEGDLVARYAVTAGGSAVVETVFPGSPHEMVTVYHTDGPDLVLTHYCVEGNQPRMRAKNGRDGRFEFAYDGGTNIDAGHDRHMHSATLDLVGADEIRSEWTELAEGKPVMVVKSHLVRKAR